MELQGIVQVIKQSITMPEVARMYSIPILRSNFIKCPFHGEKTGSMKLYKTHAVCFGCGLKLDIIDFVQKMDGVGFKQALARLNTYFNLGLDLTIKPDTQALQRHKEQIQAKQAKREYLQEKIWELAALHCEYWQKCLILDHTMEVLMEELRACH